MRYLIFFTIFIVLIWVTPQIIAAQETATSNSVTTKVGNPSGGAPGSFNFVYYCQGDPKWQNSCFQASSTCGPTSMAMVLSAFGSALTPADIDSSFNSTGIRACGGGDSHMTDAVTDSWLKSKGYTFEPLCAGVGNCNKDDFLRRASDFINNGGYIVIASQPKWHCPKNCLQFDNSLGYYIANHILVIDGADISTRQLNIRDPLNCSWLSGDGSESTPGGFKRSVDEGTWFYGYAIKKL